MKLLDYPLNKPVFTTIYVTKKNAPVTYISIDDEGDIQAFSDDEAEMEEAMIITLEQLFSIDPSLKTIADVENGAKFDKDIKTNIWTKS